MNHRDLVVEYLRRFASGDIDGVAALLHPDLRFSGPLFTFDGRDAYVASLRRSPPEPSRFEIIDLAEHDDRASVFYVYQKPAARVTIAQLFTLREGKIGELLLVFDTGELR